MKIKLLSRREEDHARGSAREQHRQRKNADPALHPFERAREYTRAVRAVKLERMFAKPFLGAMDDHGDTVTCCSTSPSSLSAFVSGGADGEVIVWDLPSRAKLWSVFAHAGSARGVSVAADGGGFFSVGADRCVKLWRLAARAALAGEVGGSGGGGGGGVAPVRVWDARAGLCGVDGHVLDAARFATCGGAGVEVWDVGRGDPLCSLAWGAHAATCVRWNPGEAHLLLAASSDRGVALYDTRAAAPLCKATFTMNANAAAWNPREPINFTLASEDSNLYTFDMRRLDAAACVHKGHTAAVMDVHFSPTGREFASAGYDRTVKLWAAAGAGAGERAGRARDTYHGQRMGRVWTVRFTPDGRFLLSGSDDANVRLWKARASEALAPQLPRERAAANYRGALKAKFAHMPEVKRIANMRRLPKAVKNAELRVREEEAKVKRKLANVRAHTKPGSGQGVPVAEVKRPIVGVE
jgi:WD repeat and SOF domain-containing protein 1